MRRISTFQRSLLTPSLSSHHSFGRRVAPYEPADYKREVGELIQFMDTRPKITNPRILVGPSTSGQVWHAEQVFATGFLDDYKDHLYAVSVEQ